MQLSWHDRENGLLGKWFWGSHLIRKTIKGNGFLFHIHKYKFQKNQILKCEQAKQTLEENVKHLCNFGMWKDFLQQKYDKD